VRVLILHSRYLSGAASGENRVVEDESRLLREGGHDVRVWAPEPDVRGPLGEVRTAASAVWGAAAARRVRAMVRRLRAEIVHVHNLFPVLSPAVLRSARGAGASVVVTLHNYRLLCLPANLLREGLVCEACVGRVPWRGVVHRCYRGSTAGSAVLASSLVLHRAVRSFDAVSRFLAVSEFVRRRYVQAGIGAGRISVKANFAWPVEPRRGPGEYFLYLGRLSSEKGVDTLVRAWEGVSGDARLLVVGDGPEAEALRRLAPSHVEFRGQIPPDEVASVLSRARALMVPSRWYEAAPRSIVEAYAAGVPVVASDIGALPEAVLDGASGRLVPPDRPEAWAEAVGLMDAEASMRLGKGAYRLWRERFGPGPGLEALVEAYRSALADPAR
jgi:glycosyltransferase involved in cell wall biosynthesis